MPDVITYHALPEPLELTEEAILGPCPLCARANIILQRNGRGMCEDCDETFTVELIVRLAVVK